MDAAPPRALSQSPGPYANHDGPVVEEALELLRLGPVEHARHLGPRWPRHQLVDVLCVCGHACTAARASASACAQAFASWHTHPDKLARRDAIIGWRFAPDPDEDLDVTVQNEAAPMVEHLAGQTAAHLRQLQVAIDDVHPAIRGSQPSPKQ